MNYAKENYIAQDLRQYLLPAMIELFGDHCAECFDTCDSYQIDHMRYGEDVNIYDLQLLCAPCHVHKSRISGDAYISRTPHCATCKCWV